jgi:ribosomal protein S18 acetylase RimI-like enzyme
LSRAEKDNLIQPPVPGSLFTIEPATWHDANDLRNIEKVCFPKDAWPLWDLIGVLTLPNVVRLKAVIGGEMVGFIAGDIRPRKQLAWIATVGVLPEQRGRGIGSALIMACEAQLFVPCVRLSVRASNQAAVHLYQTLGYQKIGLWQAYYQDHEDAVVMEKQLS